MEALNIGELEFVRDENDTPVLLKYAASTERRFAGCSAGTRTNWNG